MDRAGTALRSLIRPPDRRTPADIGRQARLELTFSSVKGRTVLEQQYAEPPLRIGHCFAGHTGVHMILASSAPGIFGGDHFDQTIRVGPGAAVTLVSQSALQVHPSAQPMPATIRTRFSVQAGGELHCEWHPTVPFAHASLDQRIDIDVAEGARLTWDDAFMAGRQGRGELWQCESVAHELRLRHAERLVYLERYRIDAHAACEQPWIGGDCAYFGAVLRLGHGDTRETADAIHGTVNSAGAYGSADVLEGDLLLVRIAAREGVAFHSARELVRALLVRNDN